MVLIDSYSESNRNGEVNLQDEHPSDEGGKASAGGQALTTPATAYHLTAVKFYLKKSGSPTGNLMAKVYSTTGTVGTDATPTGAALAESEAVDSSTVDSSDYELVTFNFIGSNQITLSASTDYFIDFEAHSANFDGSNYIIGGVDITAPTHAGNISYFVNGSWLAESAYDTCFYLYGWIPESSYSSTHPLFNQAKSGIERKLGVDATVTRQILQFGAQNTTTGWYSLDYTNTEDIEMIILSRGQAFTFAPIGIFARYNYTGFTDGNIKQGDKITDANSLEYNVLSVQPQFIGDKFVFNVAELEKIMET